MHCNIAIGWARRIAIWGAAAGAGVLVACTSTAGRVDHPAAAPVVNAAAQPIGKTQLSWQAAPEQVVNRLAWGVNTSTMREVSAAGLAPWIDRQLHPGPVRLPPSVQSQIDAMTISRRPVDQLALDLETRRKEADTTGSDEQRQAARQALQQEANQLAREAATRSVLRALYSPNQLQEQMVWFWMNHFNIHQGKHNLRVLVGDYEEHAIRPYALGRFRDLLAATARHPAMLLYLDNAQNAAGRINENYARELMELHTLGVDAGYTQRDVQELARILTGAGVSHGNPPPKLRRELQTQYVQSGLFEFNPHRHDYGDKTFLGKTVKGAGLAELDEALDRLSRHPATARFVSRKLAAYFVADEPPSALVERMSTTFLHSDGNIAATLKTMIESPEFAQSLGHKFKDPVHYVISSVRLAYDDKAILNAGPILNWLNRMGEPLYGRQTPDGYPLAGSAWASPGQMATRFEIARAIGSGSAGLFRAEGMQPVERPAFPQLANALYYQSLQAGLSQATRQALDQAASPQEWNSFLLASPEMMYR
jgi:uncharacterized protein (DUF1800 family)